jgi:anti-sigma-K factor RskA
MTRDEDDIEGLAAEYVLGALDASERADVEKRRKADAALDGAIKAWERRLGPLADRLPGIEPPPHILEAVLRRVALPGGQGPSRLPHHRTGTWGRLAIGASALAACIALLVAWVLYTSSGAHLTLVAELHRPGATADESIGPRAPAFVVTVDLQAGKATVRPTAARVRQGRSYQLWMLRHGAVTRESLGVMSATETTTLPFPSAGKFVDAALTVTLEPEGGSPTGRPTGPTVFEGKLAAPGKN